MLKEIFEFKTYCSYLEHRVGSYRQRLGLKSKMALAMGCQPTFVTQVLNGSAQLSLEQAHRLNTFFKHTNEERDFFLLMVQRDRSGTEELSKYFSEKMAEMLSKRQVLTHRLGRDQTLAAEHQALYYSSWHFAAIHIAVALPTLQTREAISTYFRLPIKKVTEVLENLVRMNLVSSNNGLYTIGQARLRLGNDSFNILKHHTNWRNQAVESLDRQEPHDLHYSGVLSLSRENSGKIKDLMLRGLQEHLKISDASAEEDLFCYCIDFFSLHR